MSRSTLLLMLVLLLVLASAMESRTASPKIFAVSQQDARGAVAAAEVSGQEAFLQIQAADREGGNVTSLAVRFNEGLEMLDIARIYMDEGLLDKAIASAESAQALFSGIKSEAQTLQVQAAANALNRREIAVISATVAAISITFFFYFLIRLWRRRGIERTMRMEIREAKAQ